MVKAVVGSTSRGVRCEVELEYEVAGRADDPAMLLVNGYAAQLISWEPEFRERLAGRGFHVIAFDNRDVGLSQKTPGDPAAFDAETTPYTLHDMANDAAELLDHLGHSRAHVMGYSMGAMIGQTFAVNHPERTLSLVSMMGTTGNDAVGQSDLSAWATFSAPTPIDRDTHIVHGVEVGRIQSGPWFDAESRQRYVATAYDRSHHPVGGQFQMLAIKAAGDRTESLRSITAPTLVVHGRVDPIVALSGADATAAAIPDSRLLVLDDMGHDRPPELWSAIIDVVVDNATR